MKKLLSIILMASMIVTLTPIACGGALTQSTAYADTYTCKDGIVYALSDSTATVTGWTDDIKKEVEIPATVTVNDKSYDVTIIADYAFQGSEITKITFAENSKLETIGKGAFYSCKKIGSGHTTKIKIPASVTRIESKAFYECHNARISFEENSELKYIGDGAFYECGFKRSGIYEFVKIEIPAGVESIGKNAFKNCSDLKTITFAEGSQLKDIGDGAFSGCAITGITIPATVSSIGQGVFSKCGSLTSVTFDGNNPNFTSDTQAIYDKNKTKLIEVYNASVTEYTIPETVKEIEEKAFSSCSNLATITFGGTQEQWDALNVTLPKLTTGTTNVIFKKKSSTAPSAVKAETVGYNTITLKKIDKSTTTGAEAEYRIVDGATNGGWKDSNVFENLTPGTEYTFEARYKAINVATGDNAGDYVASPTTTSVKIKTLATVTFNSAGGTSVTEKTNLNWTDKVLDAVTNPSRIGYIFDGWKCGDTSVTSETTYESLSQSDTSEGITLVAQWTECTNHVYGCTKCGTAYSGSGSASGGSGESGGSSGSGESGGSSSSGVQKPTVVTPTNGTITLYADGTIAVIIPDKGYEIASVILNSENKGTYPVLTGLKTGDEVKATFQKSDSGSSSGSGGSSSSGNSGSSSGGSSVRKPTVVAPTNGKITILSDGKTAVIIPDDGYEVASVILNGEDKGTFPVLMNLKSSDKIEAKFQKSGEALNAAVNAAVSSVVKITVKSLDSMKMSSTKTAKGNIKTTLSLSKAEKSAISDLSSLGYTVKYRFYRSTKKSSGYKAMTEKTSRTYTNTSGKTGTRYYYKARIMVYDQTGTLVASTALKSCKYATRIK